MLRFFDLSQTQVALAARQIPLHNPKYFVTIRKEGGPLYSQPFGEERCFMRHFHHYFIVVLFVQLPSFGAADENKVQESKGVKEAARRAWGPEQATGKPDTPGAGDIQTAWASATPDGKDEWLELEYAEAVVPVAIIVHETFNPGAVYKVTAYSKSGMEAQLWVGKDPTPTTAPRGISEIKTEVVFETKRVRIYLKSTEVAGWNEIDAVGIKAADGKVFWATKARASSTFADGRAAVAIPAGLGVFEIRQ